MPRREAVTIPRSLSENRAPTVEKLFWPIFPLIFVELRVTIRLKSSKKWTQNSSPSLRRLFPDRLLVPIQYFPQTPDCICQVIIRLP